MNEEWRAIEGYEGLYEVSNLGRVRTIARKAPVVRGGRSYVRPFNAKVKKQGIDAYGYPTISLVKDGKERNLTVHRFVAKAFIGECPKGYEVHHKDEIKRNNAAENLEYKPRPEHMSFHARTMIGSKNANAKLVENEVVQIKQLLAASNLTCDQIAARYNISRTTIIHIKQGKKWGHV